MLKIYHMIYTTANNQDFIQPLIDEKLVFCINIIDQVRSIYHWEDKLCNEQEYIFLIKTNHLSDTVQRLKSIHPYTNPAILSWDVTSHSQEYDQWVLTN
jgi:periplasmic divalent cation tolerance protein